jgi:hypothetical protein
MPPPPLILAYHGIADVPPRHDPAQLFVPPRRFRSQVRQLKRRGYEFVHVRELARRLHLGTELRAVCALTFDDGSEDNATVLAPLLREVGVPGTLYVCPGLLGRPYRWVEPEANVRFLDADQLAELSREPLIEVGSHTREHPLLTWASAEEAYEGADPRFHLIHARRPSLAGVTFFASLPAVVSAEIRRFSPDVVITQSPYEAFACLASLTGRESPKLIVELHADWRSASRLYGSRARHVYARLTDRAAVFALRRADAIRTLSPFTEALAKEATGREPVASFTAYLDLECFAVTPRKPLPVESGDRVDRCPRALQGSPHAREGLAHHGPSGAGGAVGRCRAWPAVPRGRRAGARVPNAGTSSVEARAAGGRSAPRRQQGACVVVH